MKIIELIVNLEKQTVLAKCLYNVQDVEHPIQFILKEQDLYSVAGQSGKDSWDNEDVISLAKTQLGIDVKI